MFGYPCDRYSKICGSILLVTTAAAFRPDKRLLAHFVRSLRGAASHTVLLSLA